MTCKRPDRAVRPIAEACSIDAAKVFQRWPLTFRAAADIRGVATAGVVGIKRDAHGSGFIHGSRFRILKSKTSPTRASRSTAAGPWWPTPLGIRSQGNGASSHWFEPSPANVHRHHAPPPTGPDSLPTHARISSPSGTTPPPTRTPARGVSSRYS
jgi:hypothetical protein